MKKIIVLLMLFSLLTIPLPLLAEEIEEDISLGFCFRCYELFISQNMYSVDVVGNNVTVRYLTTQFTDSLVIVTNLETGVVEQFDDLDVVTYHTIEMQLERGTYEILPVAGDFVGTVEIIEIR